MPMVTRTNYERPKSGTYVGVVADIVDLGMMPDMTGKLVPKIRIVWLLNANDSQGRPLSTIDICTVSNGKKAKLRKIALAVLGYDPPPEYNTDILIGKSKKLFIQVTPSEKTGEPFPKVMGIMELEAGEQPMAIPADYKREAAKPQSFANQAQPVQSFTQPGTVAPATSGTVAGAATTVTMTAPNPGQPAPAPSSL